MKRTWSLLLVSALALASCDDLTAGQTVDDPAPPRLVHVLVQDEQPPPPGRSLATDLLDTAPLVACSDQNVCPSQTASGVPGFDCDLSTMTCPDTLHYDPSVGVEVGTPVSFGGVQIRLVFSKTLDPSIETVTIDNNGVYTYKLADGIIELDGPLGKVDTSAYWDPTGSPTYSSDPVGAFGLPFGPALVLKPTSPLSPKTKYTIVLHSSQVHDKKMQAPTDNATPPAPLPDPYKLDFVVEDLQVLAASPDGSATSFMTAAPDDVLQLAFNAGVALASATITLTSAAGTKVPIEAWLDVGEDPTMCQANDRLLDVVAVSTPGTPTDLAEGDYVLDVEGLQDDGLRAATFSAKLPFTVKGPDHPADDPSSVRYKDPSTGLPAFLLPEGCMAAPDGGPPGDAAAPPDGGAPPDGSAPPDQLPVDGTVG
jgi:hypothetical protein